MRTIKLLDATEENFKIFGWLISQSSRRPNIENEYVKYWDRLVPFSSFMGHLDLGFLICKRRPPICGKMEMLPSVEEVYICLDAEPAVFFVAPDAEGAPDILRISAFLFKGASLVVRQGIWHWSPFPLMHESSYALLTSNDCIISKDGKIFVNSKKVLVTELVEPFTVTQVQANNP